MLPSLTIDPNEAQELVAGLGLSLETAKHTAGHSGSGGFLDAAHAHTEMACFHDNCNALGVEGFHNGVGDFFGETFLNLKTTGEHVCDTRELGEANDIVLGNVPNVHLSIIKSIRISEL